MTIIIGLLGPAGSGKSLVAKHLETKYDAKVYTLAAPLKQLVGNAFELTKKQLYGSQEDKETVDPRYNVSPRWLFQRIGTEGFRKVFGPDFWVDQLYMKVLTDNPSLAVVDDVRFVSEAVGLKAHHAKIWQIYNNNRPTRADAAHASEAEWINAPYDTTIVNDGKDLQKLLTQVDELCYFNRITPTRLV